MKNFPQRNKNESDEYETPMEIFEKLNSEFGFNLDPCSTDSNCKCDKHYTKAEDGLAQNWGGIGCFAIHHTAI